MRKCTVCKHENADNNFFCEKCGSKLEAPQNVNKTCIACGFKIESNAKFCRKCGAAQPKTGSMFAGNNSQKVPNKPEITPQNNLTQTVSTTAAKQKSNQSFNPPPAYKPPNQPPKNTAQPTQKQPPKKKNSYLLILILVVFLAVAATFGGTVYYLFTNKLLFFADKTTADTYQSHKDMPETEKNNTTEKNAPTQKPNDTAAPTLTTSTDIDRTKPIKLTANVTASSELASFNNAYSVNNLIDGNADTAWAEGVQGNGEGELINYQLDEPQTIYGIAILPGYLINTRTFLNNSRPITLKISSNTYAEALEITDYTDFTWDLNKTDLSEYLYFIEFKQPINAQSITISIEQVMAGAQENTSISELYLFTYPEKGKESQYSGNDWTTLHNPTLEEYILPESSTRFLSKQELQGLTADQCLFARNEIYAKHGRIFDNDALQAYFNSCSWYNGTVFSVDFNEDILNQYEKSNRDLIVEYELYQGYR